MRPIVEIMTCNFSLLALDQIMNTAATLLHMSGGQFNVPVVIRMATGGGKQLAAQHSHSLEGWYAHIPGLKVLTPATVEDALDRLAHDAPAGEAPMWQLRSVDDCGGPGAGECGRGHGGWRWRVERSARGTCGITS